MVKLKVIRSESKKATRKFQEERTRRAYARQPDAESEADDWSSAEEWKPSRKKRHHP